MQNSKSRIILIGLTFFFLIVFSNSHSEGLPPLTHNLTAIDKIVIAPVLRFHNLDEEMVDLKKLKGKIVVVNFWATWCPPCRREMGSLENLYQLTKDKNVEILAVNIGEDMDTVFSFLGTIERSPTFPMLFDSNAASMKKWGVKGLPTTYIINPDGNVVYKAVGGREFDHPSIISKITQLGL